MYTYLILLYIITAINAANITDFEANCHILHTSGYGYNTFFHIPKTSKNADGSICIKFSVIAPSNAHILLSPKNAPNDKEIVYEIVLGAGKNTFSTIRKLRTSIRVSVNTAGILDEKDLKVFWVNVANDSIGVGEDSDSKPLVKLQDTEPIPVNYMAFGAWVDVTATWIYDCKNRTSSDHLKDEKNLTAMDRFTIELLDDYDVLKMPQNEGKQLLLIRTNISINYMNMDLNNEHLETIADFHFAWNDTRLKWNPQDYGNMKSVKLDYYSIWRPKFFLFGPTKGNYPQGKVNKVRVQNSGEIQWTLGGRIMTNCNRTFDDSNWPWDLNTCEIRLGFYPYSTPVNFVLSKSDQTIRPKMMGNGWKINDIIITLENSTIFDNPASNESNVLVIYVTLSREISSIVLIFIIPIICGVLMTHFSFLLPPDCSARLYLHFISLIVFTAYLLLASGDQKPAQNLQTPFIAELCSFLLMVATFHTIFTAFINNITKFDEENPPPLRIRKLLGNKGVRNLFLLPEEGLYNELEQNSNEDVKKYQNIWFTLAVILDRIIFAISSVIIATTSAIILAY